MKTMARYRTTGFNKIKTVLFTALLLCIAFMSGAIVEKSNHFLQDVYVIAPAMFDEIKLFFREQIIIKIESTAGIIKWGSAITLSICQNHLIYLIRGP